MNLLQPYLPIDRRLALYTQRSLPDRVSGAALFADISGFTSLTAALAHEYGRQRGAEIVLDIINPFYDALIQRLHDYRGAVIGFAGDSITCWFDGDDGRWAVACALDMQAIMGRFAEVVTPGGNRTTLSIKISIAVGPARRFLVGDPNVHNFEALAGTTLERMAAAEHQANQGEVLVSEEVAAGLAAILQLHEWRIEPGTSRRFGVVAGLAAVAATDPWPSIPGDAFTPEQLRPWIDKPVYDRLVSGASYLAELRPVTSLFLKFGGIDYDSDDQAGQKLDVFIRWVQSILSTYEGFLLQVTIGDKGSNLLAVFGAPLAHDDDMARAVAAGLDLKNPPDGLAFAGQPRIGISQGLAWAGACGGRVRCIYTVMGDEVNMAARLMSLADPGQVWVSGPVAAATGRRYNFRSLGLQKVKGHAEPAPVLEALSRQEIATRPMRSLYASLLVGREALLEEMLAALTTAGGGHGQVLRLEGQAGVGKSHLSAVFAGLAEERGWLVVAGQGQSISQNTAYYPWQAPLNRLLGLADLPVKDRYPALETWLSEANPNWLERAPLLGDVLGIALPDNPFSAQLEPRQRQAILFGSVSAILQRFTARQPLLLILEDVHWFDDASNALTLAVARALQDYPLLLLVVQRPAISATAPILPELATLSAYHQITLGDLSQEGIASLAANRLGGPVSPLAAALMFAQAQGNPFYTEELLDALREAETLSRNYSGLWELSQHAVQALVEAGCLIKEAGEWRMIDKPPLSAAHLDLPDSVQGAVLARIDRLPEAHKLTLKVASVIGRTFGLAMLNEIHPASPGRETLQDEINLAGERDFVRLEQPGQDSLYIFKHNITQEVAYSTLLFSQRRELHHHAAQWYENKAGALPGETLTIDSPLAIYAALLAHHWRAAEQAERERPYDRLAGELAAKQFANESAVGYFTRALKLTPTDSLEDRYTLHLRRENVYDVMGWRSEQENDLNHMENLAVQTGKLHWKSQVALRRAIWYDYTAHFSESTDNAQQAIGLAQQAGASDLEIQAQHALGRAQLGQEHYAQARKCYAKALALAEQQADDLQQARTWTDLGLLEYNQHQYESASQCYQKALDIYHTCSHSLGEIQCQSMFAAICQEQGRYSEAQKHLRDELSLSRAIGWRYYEAYGWFTLGNLNFYLGQYSQCREAQEQALQMWRELGSQDFEGMSLDTIGLVYMMQGDLIQAHQYVQNALAIHRKTGQSIYQAYDHNHLGLISLLCGQVAEAQEQHQTALRLRKEADQEATTLDDLAGLARIALAQNNPAQAVKYAREILAGLAAHGPDALEFPVWVYLTCYRAFNQAGQPESAHQALQNGHQLLQRLASSIDEPALRQGFLERVPWNHELLSIYFSVQNSRQK